MTKQEWQEWETVLRASVKVLENLGEFSALARYVLTLYKFSRDVAAHNAKPKNVPTTKSHGKY